MQLKHVGIRESWGVIPLKKKQSVRERERERERERDMLVDLSVGIDQKIKNARQQH